MRIVDCIKVCDAPRRPDAQETEKKSKVVTTVKIDTHCSSSLTARTRGYDCKKSQQPRVLFTRMHTRSYEIK